MQPKLNLPPVWEPLSLSEHMALLQSDPERRGWARGRKGGGERGAQPSSAPFSSSGAAGRSWQDQGETLSGTLQREHELWAGVWREDPTSHLSQFFTAATNYLTQHALHRLSRTFPTSETGIKFANTSPMICDVPRFVLVHVQQTKARSG